MKAPQTKPANQRGSAPQQAQQRQELAHRPNSNLSVATNPSWDTAQVQLLKQQICIGATDAELALFGAYCARTGLDPFSRQIYMICRGDNERGNRKAQIQTGIDGFRAIADSSGNYGGSETYWCGPDGEWVDVWVSDGPPYAAKTVVWKIGVEHPFCAVAHWDDYAQYFRDRDTKKWELGDMWRKMGRVMIGKCSEALALRRAFPAKLGGIYIPEEMREADAEIDATTSRVPPSPKPPKPAEPPKQTTPSATTSKSEPKTEEKPPKKEPKSYSKDQVDAAIASIRQRASEVGIKDEDLNEVFHRLAEGAGSPLAKGIHWINCEPQTLVAASFEKIWRGKILPAYDKLHEERCAASSQGDPPDDENEGDEGNLFGD